MLQLQVLCLKLVLLTLPRQSSCSNHFREHCQLVCINVHFELLRKMLRVVLAWSVLCRELCVKALLELGGLSVPAGQQHWGVELCLTTAVVFAASQCSGVILHCCVSRQVLVSVTNSLSYCYFIPANHGSFVTIQEPLLQQLHLTVFQEVWSYSKCGNRKAYTCLVLKSPGAAHFLQLQVSAVSGSTVNTLAPVNAPWDRTCCCFWLPVFERKLGHGIQVVVRKM